MGDEVARIKLMGETIARSCDLEGDDIQKKQNQIGPFLISHNNLGDQDLQLIQYVFDPSRDASELVIRYPRYLLDGARFTSLRPKTAVKLTLIDIFVENFNKIVEEEEEEEEENVSRRNLYLPWSFSAYAMEGIANLPKFDQWQDMKKYFMPSDFVNYDKIFIPAHISSSGLTGHCYLYVVHLNNNVIEIWDSAPSNPTDEKINERTQKLLLALDKLFDNDKSKRWTFANFSVKMAENTPRQPNNYDCCIFVIKFMKDSATDAIDTEPFESDRERLELALELLKSELNKERNISYVKAATLAWMKQVADSFVGYLTKHAKLLKKLADDDLDSARKQVCTMQLEEDFESYKARSQLQDAMAEVTRLKALVEELQCKLANSEKELAMSKARLKELGD